MQVDGAPLPEDDAPLGVLPLTPHAPRVVIGDRGAGWIMEGWDCFKAAAGQWITVCVVGFILLIAIDYSPTLSVINSLLNPVWLAGLMAACHAQYLGERVEVWHLFAGFKRHLGRLLACGALQIFLYVVVFAVFMGSVIVDLVEALFPGRSLLELDLEADLQAALQGMPPEELVGLIDVRTLLVRVLLLLAVMVPLLAAFWYAPVLIVLSSCTLGQALKLSLAGCLKNMWPFLIYGLCSILLALLIPITLGLAMLVLAPIYFLSIYLSYRDIFID